MINNNNQQQSFFFFYPLAFSYGIFILIYELYLVGDFMLLLSSYSISLFNNIIKK